MAGTARLQMDQGTDFSESFTYQDSAGAPIDVTGWTALMRLRTIQGLVTVLTLTESSGIAVGTTDGTFTVTVTNAQTARLNQDCLYDLVVTDTGGVKTRLSEGVAEISLGISQSAAVATAPAAPTLLAASAAPNAVGLGWADSSNGGSAITSHTVLRGTAPGAETVLASGLSPSLFLYRDSTAVNGTTYYYKVQAVNAVGTSTPSNERSATPPGVPGPTVPDAPTLTRATAGNAQVALTWTAGATGGSPITSFTLLRSTTSGGETSYITGLSPGATTYTDTSVTNGTEYFYELEAINALGTSTPSNELNSTPAAPAGVTIAQPSVTGGPPGARGEPGSCEYPPNGKIYYFGGNGPPSGAALADTWSFDPATDTWAAITTASAPANVATTLGYDPITGLIIMFGGDNESTWFNFTATMDPTVGSPDWTEIFPATVPGVRSGHSMFNDPVTGHLMMYGGNTGSPTYYDDLWEWTGTNWSLRSSALTGTGRTGAFINKKPTSDNKTVIFGGADGVVLNDTHVWDGTSCTLKHPATVPSARFFGGCDVTNTGQALIYGGSSRDSTVNKSDCWTWDGTNWTLQTPTGVSIGGLSSQAMDFHPPTGEIISAFGSQGASAGPTPTDISTVYVITVGTSSPTAPSAPRSFAATPGNTQAVLTWTAPATDGGSAITSYTLLRGTTSGGETSVVTGISAAATSYTNTGLTNGTHYYFELIAINAIGSSVVSGESSATPTSSPTAALLGFYSDFNTISAITSLGSTMGVSSKLKVYSFYTNGSSWSSIGSWTPPGTLPGGATISLAVNMVADGDSITNVSANLSHYATLAGAVPNGTIIRLGWEFDIGTGTGGFGHVVSQSAYIAAWQSIYTTMKGVNSTLLFDWCCNTGTSTLTQLEAWYPGDAYVDYIGGDHYDNSGGGGDFSQFGAVVNLANLRSKPVSCGEWGLATSGHTDNPTFIDDAKQFFLTPAVASARYGWPSYTVAYHSYFNSGGFGIDLTSGSYPNSKARFTADFS